MAAALDEALFAARSRIGLHPTARASVETRPDPSFTEDRLDLPTRNNGAALIAMRSRFQACFLGSVYRTAPLLLDRTSRSGSVTPGSCPQLKAIFGEGAFDPGGLRFAELVAGGSLLGREVADAFAALGERTARARAEILRRGGPLFDSQSALLEKLAGLELRDPTAVGFAEIGKYSDGSLVSEDKLTKAIMCSHFDTKQVVMEVRARELPPSDLRRCAFGQATKETAVFFLDSMHPDVVYSTNEFAEALNFSLGLKTGAGCAVHSHSSSFGNSDMDEFGWGLNNVRNIKDTGLRTKLHNLVNTFVEKAALSVGADFSADLKDFIADKLPPGGLELECVLGKGSSKLNIIPDFKFGLEEDEVCGKVEGGVELTFDTKTVSSKKYYFGPFNLREQAVTRREAKVPGDYISHGVKLDEVLYPGLEVAPNQGPIERFLRGLAHPVQGAVVGAFGEISPNMRDVLKYIADRHERRFASLAGVSLRGKGGRFLWDLKRRLTLMSIRGWARLRLARARQVVGLCSRPDLTPDVPRYDPHALLASADGLHDALVSATHPSMFW
jgi:hypothetical protein